MINSDRYNAIMARVDAWGEEYDGYGSRYAAASEVSSLLADPSASDWNDDRIVDSAISAWVYAE